MDTRVVQTTAVAAIALLEIICNCGNTTGNDFFSQQIVPILQRHCVECHNDADRRGGLSLQSGDGMRRGSESGAVLDSSNWEHSLLLTVLQSSRGESALMPKDRPPLTASEVDLIARWLVAGAVWPKELRIELQSSTDRQWWSLKPLEVPRLDVARQSDERQWRKNSEVLNPIDVFVAEKHLLYGLEFAPQANRRTMIRRLYYDLIGLPPSPHEVEQFVADEAPDAYERLVDRLLSSPRLGERWARHWLDVVHYGDTHGYDKDKPRLHAWPYRDYVIRSLNADKSWSQFAQEQIAGDALYPGTVDGIEGLGFISAGPWDFVGHAELPESKTDGQIARHFDRDDMVRNSMQSFCSITVGCAQCHHHKFDPISQQDYYRLQAVFAAVDRADKPYIDDETRLSRFLALKNDEARFASELAESLKKQRTAAGEPLARIENEIKQLTSQANKDKPPDNSVQRVAELQRQSQQLLEGSGDEQLRRAIRVLRDKQANTSNELKTFPAHRLVYAGTVHTGSGNFVGTGASQGKPRPIFVLARGDVTRRLEEVQPGGLAVFPQLVDHFKLTNENDEALRRAALAGWLTDSRNPLTWRSIANRVWQYHFGRAIAETSNDLGRMGTPPTHPELVDWMATQVRDEGQSLKRLHRSIVTSRTYRQAIAHADPETIRRMSTIDSDNRWLWRMNSRRLEAEAVRDSLLHVAGMLDNAMGGPAFQDFVIEKPEHSPHYEYRLHNHDDPRSMRRSVYRFVVRSQLQPFMTTLDCADPSLQVDRRTESASALQALTMLNNGLVVTMARHFAARLAVGSQQLEAQVRTGFELVTGRTPSPEEQLQMCDYADRHGLVNLCRMLLNLNEFIFVD